MYIDVHAHLDSCFFTDREIEQCIKHAKQSNVGIIIANGIHKDTNRHVLALAKKHPEIKAALGIYPWEALQDDAAAGHYTKEAVSFDADEEIAFIKSHKKDIVAIGEVGIDRKNQHKTNKQGEIFEKFIELSKELNKPLIVHSRKAEEEVINLLEQHDAKKVILHCFNGKKSLWQKIKDNNWYCSIPTNCVKSEHFQQLIAYMPMTHLFAETDSPFLSPFKGRHNEPAFVVEAYKVIAKLKNMDLKEVENCLWKNYQQLFL